MNLKQRVFKLLLIVAVSGAFGFLFALRFLGNDQKKETATAIKVNDTTIAISREAMANIMIAKVKSVHFPENLELTGRISVTEDRTTVVPARVAGRTESIYVASGVAVKKGEPLMSLFSPDFLAAREEYIQSLKQSRGATQRWIASEFLDFSKMARKRLETMGLNQQDIDSFGEDESKVTNLTVRAPKNGFVIVKNAALGNFVNVGDPLFTIGDISKVWFTGDLYVEDLLKVQTGQEVSIASPTGEKIHGSVSFISPMIDPTARTIKIRALMDNQTHILKADMYVQGNLIVKELSKLVVPSRAVTRLENVDTVFRRISEDRFQKVEVKLGDEQGDLVIVESGLSEGDEIVSGGGALLLNAILSTASR